MRNFLTILFFSLFFTIYAQKEHDGLRIHRTIANYGEVEVWLSEVDSFLITNTSTKTIYILNQMVPRGFEIRLPKMGIEPGASDYIEIIYDPSKVGPFKEQLKFYHSGSTKPFFIELKGEIKSFDEYARMACPSFSRPTRRISFDMEITVIDSLTKAPIHKALVELGKGEDFLQFRTNKLGLVNRKSQLGLFFIYTEAKGYKTKEISHYFNPKSRAITITLVPLKQLEVPQGVVDMPDKILAYEDTASDVIEKVVFDYKPLSLPTLPEENKNFPLSKFNENNIVFLIDVSSSMRGKDRLELLKKSMIQLTYMLRSVDKVTIVTYADEAQVVLKTTTAKNKEDIIKVINELKASGSTNGGKAIKKAYKVLKDEFLVGGNNQIVLATDGGFNGLGRSEGALNWLVKRKANNEMYFSVLGFGKSRRGKDLLEQLAKSGEGDYVYIQTEEQANKDVNLMIMRQSAIK